MGSEAGQLAVLGLPLACDLEQVAQFLCALVSSSVEWAEWNGAAVGGLDMTIVPGTEQVLTGGVGGIEAPEPLLLSAQGPAWCARGLWRWLWFSHCGLPQDCPHIRAALCAASAFSQVPLAGPITSCFSL